MPGDHGDAQLAKLLGVPIGLTVIPENTHDGKHMRESFGQAHKDLIDGSTMIFDAGANNKTVLDTIVEDSMHCLIRKHFNKSDDAILAGFSEEGGECIDAGNGEYCLKRVFPSRVNCYFFSREFRNLKNKGVEKRARKKLKEAKDLQRDLEQGKKLNKRYQIDNVLIKATSHSRRSSPKSPRRRRRSASSWRRAPRAGRSSSAWSRTGTWTRVKRGPSTGPRTWRKSCSRR